MPEMNNQELDEAVTEPTTPEPTPEVESPEPAQETEVEGEAPPSEEAPSEESQADEAVDLGFEPHHATTPANAANARYAGTSPGFVQGAMGVLSVPADSMLNPRSKR